jgi:hypothetical protein
VYSDSLPKGNTDTAIINRKTLNGLLYGEIDSFTKGSQRPPTDAEVQTKLIPAAFASYKALRDGDAASQRIHELSRVTAQATYGPGATEEQVAREVAENTENAMSSWKLAGRPGNPSLTQVADWIEGNVNRSAARASPGQ